MATPHFLLFPFMAQGHMIPMVDLAKLLAHRGAIVTIVVTPNNAARNHSVLSRAIDSGLQIRVVQLEFPWKEGGLPEGCDNVDLLPSLTSMSTFFKAASLLYDPSEKLFLQLNPRPTSIISDSNLPWTIQLSQKFHVPRLVFYTLSAYFLLCLQCLMTDSALASSDSDSVIFSALPDPVQFRKSELPRTTDVGMAKFGVEMTLADAQSYGAVFNSFEEMEPKYIAEFRKTRESPEKVWCVGPVSLCNDDNLDKAERGNKASVDPHQCIKWLDGQQPTSVVYVSLGSICNLVTAQLIELGLGLEASNKPFIWVIRKANLTEELLKWLEEYDLEGKTKGRSLVIRGWAPQILILSHPSIGCFLTHCGWNSSTEGISAGVPMITWPLFVDQVFNYKLIVEVLKVGVGMGVETVMHLGEEEEMGVVVKREKVREAIEMVFDGEDREEMRQRSKKLAVMAKRAVEEGGSSHSDIKLLIQDIVAHGGGHHI
ncbi:UDP-glycosyltransferase 73C6-like [Cucurbita pepo subsp. pepo]|uniref:UDP-glycosyltransferase 73C6-like n=1 Tax=Cucurbita pepo subsp. pepo TaxID=3664 RepID=UPI000C9D9237|nr:UDP-glycosyltransferase 73C6-like [Cucurbita pepo subsp. pepo]